MGTTRLTLEFYWRYTKRYPKLVALGFFNTVQSAINAVIIPLLLGFATAKLTNHATTGLSFTQILLSILGLSVAAVIANRIGLNAINHFEAAATQDITDDIADHLIHESYDFHSRNFSGALINQATRLNSSYITFADVIMLDTLRNLVLVVASLVVIVLYDARLAAIIAVMATIGYGTTIYLTRKYFHLQKKAIKITSEQTAYLADMVTNAATVKTFASEDYELKSYNKINRSFTNALLNAWGQQLNSNSIRMALAGMMNIAVMAYGIYGIQHGIIPVGVFIAAQIYTIRISVSFWDLSSIVRTLEKIFADAHEMIEIMNTPLELIDQPGANELIVRKGELCFNNVGFHYPDNTRESSVFEGFNLVLKPGEKVGLVGRSGGGKTTVTKLALRFMDIQAGNIQIDDQDISHVTQSSLRQAIGYVPQEPLLFHRTLAQNIGYGKASASQQEIVRAAKLAQAHDFITSLPNQYDTEVGERGVKLSGGQRQRIAIARAILRNAPILVLDEATSALDSESEVAIQKALWELMENKTALVIAHRLSTIQKMDRIIVLEKGKIIEEGTHKQLLTKKGQYAELWKHQSGGFLEDE